MSITPLEYLFSYGTLQNEEVQFSTFGRKLVGSRDSLPGYRQSKHDVHLNIQFTGYVSDSVEGVSFALTRAELEQADIYEATANYRRIEVQLKSGNNAWVYLFAESS
jgi:gamma-glutamylcyclotransferase (GGCT)/AIG2-like uncharacterized protein YtfP